MKLITKEIREKLLKAGYDNMRPICKFFNPCGAGTWLICSMEEFKNDDGSVETVLQAYCDLNMGCIEFGSVSLEELQSLRLPFGMSIERDLSFEDDPSINWFDKKTLAGC